jgi:hypothetical protein
VKPDSVHLSIITNNNAAAAATGSERSYSTWREADLEWLGVKPDSVMLHEVT